MFHVKHADAVGRIKSLVERVGLVVGEDSLGVMVSHVDWVIEVSARTNLTAIRDADAALRLHLLDSLLALPELAEAPPGRLLDLGTGGGFPGFPLAVADSRDAVLLDSVRKKVDLLASFLSQSPASKNVVAIAGRAEDISLQTPAAFAVVVARAVAPLPSLVELAAPLLKDCGRLIALKGPLSADELQSGDRVGEVVGLTRASARRVVLPEGGEQRTIVVYEKTAPSSIPLPRRTGRAQTRPLA